MLCSKIFIGLNNRIIIAIFFYRPQKDTFHDFDQEKADKDKEADKKKLQARKSKNSFSLNLNYTELASKLLLIYLQKIQGYASKLSKT